MRVVSSSKCQQEVLQVLSDNLLRNAPEFFAQDYVVFPEQAQRLIASIASGGICDPFAINRGVYQHIRRIVYSLIVVYGNCVGPAEAPSRSKERIKRGGGHI